MDNTPETSSGRPDSPFRRPPPRPAPRTSKPPSAPAATSAAPQRARDRLFMELLLWGLAAIAGPIIIGAIFGTAAFLISLFVVTLAAALFARAATRAARRVEAEMYCPHCGASGVPRTVVRGSTVAEILLWLAGLLPGLIYSIWRLSSRHEACPTCRQAGMIPANSPRALELKHWITTAGPSPGSS